MKKLFITLLLTLASTSMVVSNADAKRLGGGGSIGKQSQSVSKAPAQSANNQAAAANAPAAAPPKPASPWKGILGGALLGLGLGALFSHLGLGGAMGSMIGTLLMVGLLALAAMFIYRMFKAKSANNVQPSYAGGYPSRNTPDIGSRIEPAGQPAALQSDSFAAGAAVVAAPWGIPAGFDVPGFLRNAKTYFIRLQAAWDKADTNDIREFTTAEMFAELKLQVQERGATPNNTDVVSLDAEMMGVETIGSDYLASVKFTGMIKEAVNAPAEPFTEVWNLTKPTSGQGGWLLAGIQQL